MTNNYIQIGKDYRLTGIGGPDSNLYQVWKQIRGGGYRKAPLQISILNKLDFTKQENALRELINRFLGRKLDTCCYVLNDLGSRKPITDISTENILQLASNINPDETITIFYKTK